MWRLKFCLVLKLFFFFFFGCASGVCKFPGQKSNLCLSIDLSCYSDNARSLTHCVTELPRFFFFQFFNFLQILDFLLFILSSHQNQRKIWDFIIDTYLQSDKIQSKTSLNFNHSSAFKSYSLFVGFKSICKRISLVVQWVKDLVRYLAWEFLDSVGMTKKKGGGICKKWDHI